MPTASLDDFCGASAPGVGGLPNSRGDGEAKCRRVEAFWVAGCMRAGGALFGIVNLQPMSTGAHKEIYDRVIQIAGQVTALHPLVATLQDPTAKDAVFKALFELTRQVEVIKKQLLRLEKRDDSAEL
jgi:hypothetical protein